MGRPSGAQTHKHPKPQSSKTDYAVVEYHCGLRVEGRGEAGCPAIVVAAEPTKKYSTVRYGGDGGSGSHLGDGTGQGRAGVCDRIQNALLSSTRGYKKKVLWGEITKIGYILVKCVRVYASKTVGIPNAHLYGS